MPRAREELAELVALRSVADPRQIPPEECERAAQWVLDRFAEVGFTDAQLEETADGSKAVVGSRPCAAPGRAHGAPVRPLRRAAAARRDAWRTPPFELTEVDGRWYGRGTADCKGNILMHLTALRALGDDVPVNLKLVVEGSEEQGTGGLEAFVPAHADLLRADTILVCDTGNAAVGPPGSDRQPARHGQRRGDGRGPRLGAPLRDVRGCRAGRPRGARGDAGHAARRRRQHHGHGAGQHPALDRRAVPARAVPRRTPACSTESRCSETAACRTCCGRARR